MLIRNNVKFLAKILRNSQKQRLSSRIQDAAPFLSRDFHASSAAGAKIHHDTENNYAHGVLEKYNYNIFKGTEEQQCVVQDAKIEEILKNSTSDINQLYDNFKALVKFCNLTQTCITDERFDSFIDNFTDHCNKLSDDQLIECISLMRLLPATEGINVRNFVELWSTLDYACIDRLEKWPLDKILLVCDHWYVLNLGKSSEFLWLSLRKIGRKIVKLSPNDLVQTMFYCNLVRKPLVEMFDFEVRFNNIIDSLSIEEISVMCMGFFKTQTPVRSALLIDKIYKRLFSVVDTIDDLTLVNIIKLLRYSTRLPQADLLIEMMSRLGSQVERLSLLSCLHVALAGCDLQICYDPTIEKIIQRFSRDIDDSRLKDMERMSHVMGLFNIHTKSGAKKELSMKILRKVRDRVQEIISYPRCFPQCLHYLTLGGYYDEELIDVALSEKFLRHAYGEKTLLSREIFCLDSFARINLGDSYTGNKLTARQRRTMGKLLTHYIPVRNGRYKLSLTDKILLDVKDSCDVLHKHSTLRHVLPHFERPDIIIAYDKAKKTTLDIADNLFIHSDGKILTREDILQEVSDKENVEIVVVTVGGWNNFLRNNDRITGLLKLKVDQLKILGYTSILIPWSEWREQETSIDRHNYVRRKFSEIF